MNRSSGILPVLVLLAWLAPRAAAQDVVWIDTQFHRVYLRNGNFIDGKIVQVNNREVHLDVVPGSMTFRLDMVDRIELIKMRTLGEKPKLDPPIKRPGKDAPSSAAPAASRAQPRSGSLLATPDLESGFKDRVEAILGRLRVANPDQKDDLIAELARLGPEAAPYLASMMGTVDDESCQRLAQALIKLKEPTALPYLYRALGDERAYVRLHALLVIGETGTLESAGQVRSLLGDHQEAVRASAIKALHALGDVDSLPEILEGLESKDEPVRMAAINASLDLGRKNGKMDRVAEALHKALETSSEQATLDLISGIGRSGRLEEWTFIGPYLRDGDPKTRSTAAAALGALAAPDSQDLILSRLTQEEDKRTRIQLAVAVRALKIQKAIEPLIDWLKSEDPDVAAAAETALRAVTNQKFGVDYAKWSEWWEQAKKQ